MNILHYALGFPPYRTGGLTKYCMDLMETQKKNGDNVGLMWPGTIRFIRNKNTIKKHESKNGIESYEVINPLPVPLDEGIKDIQLYMRKGNLKEYILFLKEIKPNVIYIHTLMGLHQEFVEAAIKLGIKTIYITHDYFGLCPKVTLFRDGKVCDLYNKCENCYICNKNALSMSKIVLLQSNLYRTLKDTYIVKKMRKKHRTNYFQENSEDETLNYNKVDKNKTMEYQKLREFYISILEKIDLIHFNSTVTEKVYKKFIVPRSSIIESITHKDIKDNRKKKTFNSKKLKITYLAPVKNFKGYNVLINALNEIWESNNHKFELHLFNYSFNNKPEYVIESSKGYKYKDLKNIFDNTDVLIAPSIWYETYGFTVLEAISYGVPVVVSENVGAKDIIGKSGLVVKANDIEDLRNKILSLIEDRNILSEMNNKTFMINLPTLVNIEKVIREKLNIL